MIWVWNCVHIFIVDGEVNSVFECWRAVGEISEWMTVISCEGQFNELLNLVRAFEGYTKLPISLKMHVITLKNYAKTSWWNQQCWCHFLFFILLSQFLNYYYYLNYLRLINGIHINIVYSLGFWRWCITHRISGFSDIVHRPEKHDVSETGSVSILRWGETPNLLVPVIEVSSF
jgi:hypothetical protein